MRLQSQQLNDYMHIVIMRSWSCTEYILARVMLLYPVSRSNRKAVPDIVTSTRVSVL
jgi:hypothetical protein